MIVCICGGRPGCLLCALAEPMSAHASAIDTARIVDDGCRRIGAKVRPDENGEKRRNRVLAEIGARRGAAVSRRFR